MTFLLIPFRPPAAGGLDGPCEHTLMSTEKYHSFLHKLFGTKLSLPLKHITGTALASQTRRWQAPRSEQQESSTELGVCLLRMETPDHTAPGQLPTHSSATVLLPGSGEQPQFLWATRDFMARGRSLALVDSAKPLSTPVGQLPVSGGAVPAPRGRLHRTPSPTLWWRTSEGLGQDHEAVLWQEGGPSSCEGPQFLPHRPGLHCSSRPQELPSSLGTGGACWGSRALPLTLQGCCFRLYKRGL